MIKRSSFFLPCFMLMGGMLSVWFGKELCWDLANYHFYNPYAFLYHRDQLDFWPVSFIHQYLNPTLDIFSYFLITHFSAWSAEFLLGSIHAINAWLLFLIAKQFLPRTEQDWVAFALALLGMYGPTVLPGLGSFMNDNLVSIFVLSFVYLQIKIMQAYASNTPTHHFTLSVLSGLFLGVGFGLKLTAGIFLGAAILTTLLVPIRPRDRCCFLLYWGCAAAMAFLITSGYWLHIQWMRHHNPLFPFFNGIFQSNEFTRVNWRDARFLPHGIGQHLFYPFYFSFNGQLTADAYQDVRILILYILFLSFPVGKFIAERRMRGLHTREKTIPLYSSSDPLQISSIAAKGEVWLYCFVIFSYILWQEYFAIARYFAVIEMLSPLVIYLLMTRMIKNPVLQLVALTAIFYTIIFLMTPVHMVRARWYDHSFFNITLPEAIQQIPKAGVLIAYPAYVNDLDPRPQTYLIPFFPPQWHFIGVPFWQGKYLDEVKTTHEITTRIQRDNEPLFLLTSDLTMSAFYHTVSRFNLIPHGKCQTITSDRQLMTHQQILLCPVRKKPIMHL